MPDDKMNSNDAMIADEVTAGGSDGDSNVRTGSPFAPGSVVAKVIPSEAIADRAAGVEVLTDGVMKYTAKGSATASLMVLFFAASAAWWFPAGGILIAGLGCGLAIGGMFSDYRLSSAGLLVVHLGLFFASYTMAIR